MNRLVWKVRPINQSTEELLNQLEQKDWYLPFLETIKTEGRKQEWLMARVLLKELIGEEKEILYTSTGKPFLADNSFQISFSHTKGFVAVIVHPKLKVGIDIEYISPRIQKIRSKFMSEEEEKHIDKSQEDIHLLLHWSAKETMFKMLDDENIPFQTDLQILPFKPQINTSDTFEARETRTKNKTNFSINYLVTEQYVLTLSAMS